MNHYLCIDIGGSSIKSAIMDENRMVARAGKIRTPRNDLSELVGIVEDLYMATKDEINGIAISAPGRINCRTGYFWHGGAVSCLYHVNLKDKLEKFIPVPITIENDAKCAALAELTAGSMQDVDNGAVIVIGTGLGCGLIINHEVYHGSHFSAGEAGMCPVRLDQKYDPTQSWGVNVRAHALQDIYTDRMHMKRDSTHGKVLFAKVNSGDPDAIAALHEYCARGVSGIMSIQYLLDMEKVAIGGGYSSEPVLVNIMQEEMDEAYASVNPMYACEKPQLTLCHFHEDANLYGALYFHRQAKH